MTCYDLEPARARFGPVWVGWKITFAPYRETRVVVPDLDRLPPDALVWLCGARMRRGA